jgi:1,4-dihydroxy-2-naphthoate octaprenyltransferase
MVNISIRKPIPVTQPKFTSSRREGFWRLADPKISITSLACMFIGAAVAAVDGQLSGLWLLVLGLALFCMEVAKNAWGDVIDYDSGNDLAVAPEDRTNFSGGKRVLVDGLLSRRETWLIAFVFGGAGIGLGAVIVFFREPDAFWIGTVGLLLGWSYHGPPLKLVYRGFGELAVLLCYGPILVLSTYLIQTGELSWQAFWLSVPLGLLITAFLWVNEFPDYQADRSAGKNNLVARLGRHRASRLLPIIYLCAFGMLPVLVAAGYSAWILLAMVALPAAIFTSIRTWQAPASFYRHAPVQPAALLCFVLYALGVSGGWLLAYAG